MPFMAALAVVGSLVLATGCGSSDDDDAAAAARDSDVPASESILIGAAVSESGFMATFDGPALATLRIEIDRLNDAGGIDGRQVELETIDIKSDPAVAADAANTLVSKGIDLLITTCDFDVGGPAAVIARDAGVVTFVPCTGELNFGPQGLGSMGFTFGAPNITEAAAMSQFAMDKGWTDAYVLTDESIEYSSTMGHRFIDRFAEDGGSVVGDDAFQNSDTSIAAQITRIRALSQEPDVIVLCSYPPGGATAVLQLRQAGIMTPILADFGMDGQYWVGSIPDLSDFWVLSLASIHGDDPNPAVQELKSAFAEATGEEPATGAFVGGASAVQVFAAAVEATGTTEGAALVEFLESHDGFETVGGPVSYSAEFHSIMNRPMRVIEAQDGKFGYVTTVTPENVEALAG